MTTQPTRILLATDEPGQALYFYKMLYFSGFDVEPETLHPRDALAAMDSVPTLVLVNAKCTPAPALLAWAMLESPESRFILYDNTITPDTLLKAVESGVHGVLSMSLGIAEGARAVSRIWSGERLFRFDGGPAAACQPPTPPGSDFDSEWMFGQGA